MRNAALAGLLAICLMAVLAIFGAKQNTVRNTAETKISNVVKIAVVGDMMLARQVGVLMDKEGYDYPFRNISAFFKNFDLSVGNFESTVLDKYNYHDGLAMKFSSSPKALAQLVDANFGVVSVANNHAFDYGASGFEETKTKLQAVGISPLGHPYDLSKGIVTTVELKDKKITFLALNATVPVFDNTKAEDLVAKAKTENPDSLLIILVHWGDEYVQKHNKKQETVAHALIDSGADLIIGSHPHVVQDIEKYKGKLIFYSLGNFIFDQYFSKETNEGLLLGIQLGATTTELGIFPVEIVKSQPQIMPKDKRTPFLNALAASSTKELSDEIKKGLITL